MFLTIAVFILNAAYIIPNIVSTKQLSTPRLTGHMSCVVPVLTRELRQWALSL